MSRGSATTARPTAIEEHRDDADGKGRSRPPQLRGLHDDGPRRHRSDPPPRFTFTSPYDDHIGWEDYFERCGANAGSFEHFEIQQVNATSDGCFVLYEGRSKGGAGFRIAEYFRFEDGLIRSVEVFFGLEPAARRRSLHRAEAFSAKLLHQRAT
jgi:hypothetical protein